jgi:hypothetical protein
MITIKKESQHLHKKRSELYKGGIHLLEANVPFRLRLKTTKNNVSLAHKKNHI